MLTKSKAMIIKLTIIINIKNIKVNLFYNSYEIARTYLFFLLKLIL